MSVSSPSLAQATWNWPAWRMALSASCLIFALSEARADPLSFTSGNSQVQIVEGDPRRITIHTAAPSQENIRILGHSQTGGDCRQQAQENFDLVKPPLHGTVCFREESFTIKNTEHARTPQCLGSSTLGNVIYYRPNPAYTGTDAFQYAIVDARHEPDTIADAAITIAAPVAPSPATRPEEPAGDLSKRQMPGPMERCPDPTM